MVDFRACPRCGGDLHANQDIYGEYKECLQCGYMADVQKELARRYGRVSENEPGAGKESDAA